MGKMTDALRKARLLKEQKERGEVDVPAETDAPVSPPSALTPQPPAPTPPSAATPEPPAPTPPPVTEEKPRPAPVPDLVFEEQEVEPAWLRVQKEVEPPSPVSVLPQEEPTSAEAPEERVSAPAVSVVLPEVEPRGEPPTVAVSDRKTVLPEVEPTPVETDTSYLAVHYHKDDRTADEFRALKNRLTATGSPARVILVTSCVAGEGKTTIATNLALSFANTYGEKVVLVDGNIVRPKIGELLKLPEDGLFEVVRGHLTSEDSAVKTDFPGLWALSAGRNDGRREGLLDSKPVADLLSRLRKRFTRVIMELPPISDTGEGLDLFPLADVVLIAVMKRRTRRRRLRRFLAKAANRGAGKLHCVFIEA